MELQPQESGSALCTDARNWDEDAYRNSILKEREIQTRVVFRTVWAPSLSPLPDAIVVATSDGFIASYLISSCISQLSGGFGVSQAGNLLTADPNCFLRAHDGPAYDIKFYGNDEDSLLLSCGDDGRIRGWRWKEVVGSRATHDSEGNHIQPALDLVNPQHKGPWSSLSPIPENNALAVDTKKGSIYAATGDSCAYCWDVESGKVKMVFKGHLDYLHCIVARTAESQIITGSEDGTARIWDCRSAKCIQVINPQKERKAKGSVSCIRCMSLDASENWLVCGSGQRLSVWNLPTFECVSSISLNAPAQDVFFDDNNQILQVGAEPVVNRFDMKGTLLSQIQCSPKLAFSISLHHSGVTAVGGYGGLVDVISPFGSHLCTFHCK